MRRHKKIPYVRCGSCRFRKENTYENGPEIAAGDYCPRCGTQFTEYDELTRQSIAYAGPNRRVETEQPTSSKWRGMAAYAGALGASLAVVYGVMRWLAASTPATITINGETAPFYTVGMVDAAFTVVLFVALLLFALQHAPGRINGRRFA